MVARPRWLPALSKRARATVEVNCKGVADVARRPLAPRWPETKIVFVDEPPGDAIPAEAARFGAGMVVLGWRGHGAFCRLLAGSVSRGVAAQAQCPMLVVREGTKAVRCLVVGLDGCPNSERALAFFSSPDPGRGRSVVLVNVHPFATRWPRPTKNGVSRHRPPSLRVPFGLSIQGGKQRARFASKPH